MTRHCRPNSSPMSAAQRGASIFKLMEVSRHKSVDTLHGYVRNLGLFNDHAGTCKSLDTLQGILYAPGARSDSLFAHTGWCTGRKGE